MKILDPQRQRDILDQTYVSARDLYELYPISKKTSYEWVREVVKELLEEQVPLMPGTPTLIPIERVLKKFPLNKDGINRAAKRKD